MSDMDNSGKIPAEVINNLIQIAYDKGYQEGHRDCLEEIKEAMYKLYGNSMKPLKGREDGDN